MVIIEINNNKLKKHTNLKVDTMHISHSCRWVFPDFPSLLQSMSEKE